MKPKKLKVGDQVWWYGIPGVIIALPVDEWGEYKVHLETGEIIYDDESVITMKV